MNALQALIKGLDYAKKKVKDNLTLAVEAPEVFAERSSEEVLKQLQDPTSFIGKGVGAVSTKTLLKIAPEFQNTLYKTIEGDLIPLYTGTSKDVDFKAFKKSPRGTWLTTKPEEASAYAKDNDSMGYIWENGRPTPKNTSSRVHQVFVNIQNPYHLTTEEAKAYLYAKSYTKAQKEIMTQATIKGHDAVIYPDGSIAVADPSNIISAISPRKQK